MNRKSSSIRALGATAFGVAALLLALGAEPAGKRQNVSMQGTSFSPATLNVNVGDTVVWTNADDRDYTVIASDGSFNSGNISSNKTYEHTFSKAGSFSYYCKYHPRMKGTVVVAAPKPAK